MEIAVMTNVLRYNDDSIIHRDDLIFEKQTYLSDILKEFVNHGPCTIIIKSCRSFDKEFSIPIHECGRYQTQDITNKQTKAWRDSLHGLVEYPPSMLLSWTEQGDITKASGCFNPRNNFVQAIAVIHALTYKYNISYRPYINWLLSMDNAIKDPARTITYKDFCMVAAMCDDDLPPHAIFRRFQLREV